MIVTSIYIAQHFTAKKILDLHLQEINFDSIFQV